MSEEQNNSQGSGIVKKCKDLFEKYKSVILYLIFGGLTTLVNWIFYFLFTRVITVDELIANVIAWVAAVLFAFFTNRIWVFDAPTKGIKDFFAQMISFFGGRVATGLLEEAMLVVFVKWLGINDLIIKVVAAVVVVITNYIISKFLVFRKKKEENK